MKQIFIYWDAVCISFLNRTESEQREIAKNRPLTPCVLCQNMHTRRRGVAAILVLRCSTFSFDLVQTLGNSHIFAKNAK